jgi:hypothetical protein
LDDLDFHPELPKDFSKEVKSALEMIIVGLTGPSVLVSLHRHLKDRYGITPDEIPYRLNTVFRAVESVFGVAGTNTIARATAKRLFQNYGLEFSQVSGYDLRLCGALQETSGHKVLPITGRIVTLRKLWNHPLGTPTPIGSIHAVGHD